ncbi:SWI/SNF chromatin remodeling complex component [Pseudovirgaria hyperparasitica]|uniref:SWI/SNF chromatin remodeling complex component n=1 Tax=Pseudovirgaria hyperparasitica TaxID=470096 RepID=A0A6A6WHP1_9PEZI|nr:SWI/SNF chromatin remodeling complex component [Pseudovirgaria hyperparasitica]KAF2762322.1 SWI/SNF chromatin remodeling complex component [Pseudovirgaria hyperparasitica]
MRERRENEDRKREEKMQMKVLEDKQGGEEVIDKKFKALEYLLNQSKLYSTIMLSQMQQQEETEIANDEKGRKRAQKREEKAEEIAAAAQRRSTRTGRSNLKQEDPESQIDNNAQSKLNKTKERGRSGKKGKPYGKISDYLKREDVEAKAGKKDIKEALQQAAESDVKTSDIGIQNLRSARQPALVSGGTMRSYQLEGLEWLISLYENGLNGILADEMGLGKTIQTISFLAFLREKHSYGPFLIAAPLSTTSNWVDEFNKFTPDIPVLLYHGSKQEREELRKTRLSSPGGDKFPVVVTSYEICMNDRKHLANFGWKFIIIDEGHRIKNLNCRLIRELQSYQSANRLLITGTPLQNNLTELWSLLHFLMPNIFDKLEAFESWFDFSALKERNGYQEILSEKRQQQLVSSLHAILKPFLLRRVKTDVENMMPRKREYVLFAPLSPMQRELYQAILDGTTRSYLEEKALESISGTATPQSATSTASRKRKALWDSRANTPSKSVKSSREATPASTMSARSRRKAARKSYEEVSDRAYFASLEDEANDTPASDPEESQDEDERIQAENLQLAKRQIALKKLQNPVMQLRLCCNSPYNFFNPFLARASDDGDIVPDESLVTSSGKMHLLDSLLTALFDRGHKVLIFSQFKTQLDLLEMYATALRGWPVCRIDGSIPQSERHAQIKAFNTPATKDTEADDIRNLFLLSTRAGGQGINLAAADTVILFDSDWNPQQDLQAQDRAHRIGQTRNVIVYRFATRNTIESQLLESANSKRRLEKLVIRKGGLTGGNSKSRVEREQKEEFEELQRLLRREDGQRWDMDKEGKDQGILGGRELEILLDRSEDAYDRAEKGLDVEGEVFKTVESKGEGALLEGLRA